MTPPARSPASLAAIEYAGRGWAVFPCHAPGAGGLCSCRHPDCPSPGIAWSRSVGPVCVCEELMRICSRFNPVFCAARSQIGSAMADHAQLFTKIAASFSLSPAKTLPSPSPKVSLNPNGPGPPTKSP